jgi:hypothetical protein
LQTIFCRFLKNALVKLKKILYTKLVDHKKGGGELEKG